MKKLLCPLFVLCLLGSSCSKDNSPVENEDGQMNISSCYVVKNNNTLSENFSSPIGLYVLTEDNQPYDADSYKNFASLVSGQWKVNVPVYVEKKGKVYAYYPYMSGDNPEMLDVNMANQVDLLYSKTAVPIAPGSSSLSVKMYHALSQLSVNVEGEEVVGLTLQSPLTARFNVRTGSFSSLVDGVVSSSFGNMLLIPHTVPEGREMTIRLKDGSEYSYSLAGSVFKSGENPTFQFKLNANRETLEIISFTVEDWINDNVYNDYLR